MARYIDADKIEIRVERGINDDGVIFIPMRDVSASINRTPTADVAPKSEVAREIFEEIENILRIVKIPCISAEGYITPLTARYWAIDPNDYTELKKRYTEGEQ